MSALHLAAAKRYKKHFDSAFKLYAAVLSRNVAKDSYMQGAE